MQPLPMRIMVRPIIQCKQTLPGLGFRQSGSDLTECRTRIAVCLSDLTLPHLALANKLHPALTRRDRRGCKRHAVSINSLINWVRGKESAAEMIARTGRPRMSPNTSF